MQKLRLLFLLGLVLAVGSTLAANAQNATPTKDQGQSQAQDQKNDNGHRKHWWSLPHLHHKKQAAAANATSQTPPAKPATQSAAVHPGKITVSEKPVAKTAPAKPLKMKKTVASAHPAARPVHKTVASTGHASHATRKTVAATSHAKKTVRHNCSAEESKKDGCQARHTTKPATTRS